MLYYKIYRSLKKYYIHLFRVKLKINCIIGKHYGGAEMIDIKSKFQAMIRSWIIRFIKSFESFEAQWTSSLKFTAISLVTIARFPM